MALIEQTHTRIKSIRYDWTSDASGDATATTTAVFDGAIKAIVTVPGGATPSADYDVTVEMTTINGLDLAVGQCLDRNNAAVEVVNSGIIPCAGAQVKITVANAGAAKNGIVLVIVE